MRKTFSASLKLGDNNVTETKNLPHFIHRDRPSYDDGALRASDANVGEYGFCG
jgi:hypothetical protein